MTVSPISKGTSDWDVPLNAALADLQEQATDLQTQATATQALINPAGIYVPNGWGANWKAARDGGAATLAFVGGSSTLGYYSSDLRQKGWVDLIRNGLQAQYGDGGSGYRGAALTGVVQAADSVPAAATTAYNAVGSNATLSGSWSVGGSSFGPGAKYVFTSTVGDSYTTTVRGTQVDIYIVAGTTAPHTTYSYQIDGGAVVTVPTVGTADNIQRTTISGLAATDHTVVVKHAGTAGQYVSVCGVSGRNATGVVVNNFARYGSRAANFAASDETTNTSWNGSYNYPAHCAVLTHGPNDTNNGSDSLGPEDRGDLWAKNMRIIMERIRNSGGAVGATDLMIVLPHIGTFDTTNVLYQDYVSRARGLAEGFGAALVDMWAIGRNSWNLWNSLGYWANSSVPGAAGTDNVHPSDAGHQFIYSQIFPILSGA
jgi:hypothetical protein